VAAEARILLLYLLSLISTSEGSDARCYKFDVIPAEAGTHATLRTCNGSVSWVLAIVLEARLRHDTTRP
jgi:hypothetical protein